MVQTPLRELFDRLTAVKRRKCSRIRIFLSESKGNHGISNSKDVGDRTESKVLATLIEYGYNVSIPFGDNDKYDFVVGDSGDLYRIQCKTAWKNKAETIRFNTHSQTTKDGEYYEHTYGDAIDAFVVYYPATDTLYWVNEVDATTQKMELRFDSRIDHPSINWADSYEFDGTIPENCRPKHSHDRTG